MTEGIRTLAGREPAALPVGDTLEALEVSAEEGLGEAEVSRRLEEFGRNVLEKGSGEGVLKLLWRQVNDPLIYVLLASAVLALALGDVVDAGVVLTVVVLNALIGFVQEYRAGRAIEALASMVPASATVVRGGHRLSVPAEEVVPGDVVLLEPGDQVPADARLVAARNLQADESALTGESLPAEKGTEPVDEGAPVADRTSLVHGGTLVTHGTATAVVVGTGNETELGRVSSMLEQTTQVETPLTRQIAVVSRWITIAVAVIAVLILAAALLRGYPLVDATLAAIALAVAAIPEGLPAVITITLAIGVRRMARRSAVIRRLPAVETLGSATVVCTDKTGTLTRNEMTVRELWTPNEAAPYEVYGVGYAPEGGFMRDGHELNGTPDDLRELLLAGSLCNDAGLVQDGQGSWRVSGDPTEGALIVAARKAGLGEENLKASPRLDAVPFESERQYMATLHERPQGERVIYLKGAPEVVLERCEGAIGGGPLDREVVLGEVERMSGAGMRVLAVAAKAVPQTKGELAEEDLEGGFGLLGLEGMIDPPRQEAIEAVGACRDAGITVKMITGDHAGTASAIARQVGLVRKEEGDGTLTGGELNALSEKDLREAAARINVFARVAPEHKIRLVRALQANGEVSAMTGDGVNDAPALKQADIGVAMGITGTDVSKESADVVLTDDNFASIAAAVEEGRRIYDNLIKALAFLLPSNLGQALIILVGVAFFPVVDGAPLLPMQPTQVLWINLVVAVTLALPLAFEAKEPDVMRRPPRDPKAPVLDRSLVTRTLLVALLMALGGVGLFLFGYATGIGRGEPTGTALAEAQTMAVTTVILFQVFYLMECRSLRGSVLDIGLFSNKWVYVGIGAILLLQLGFVYLPFMNALFGSAPLGAGAWFLSFLVALIVLPVIGAEKWWRKRVHRRKPGG